MLEPYQRIRNWLRSEKGQDLAEYALLVGIIALVVAVALPPLARALRWTFFRITWRLYRIFNEPRFDWPWPWPWWPWPWW